MWIIQIFQLQRTPRIFYRSDVTTHIFIYRRNNQGICFLIFICPYCKLFDYCRFDRWSISNSNSIPNIIEDKIILDPSWPFWIIFLAIEYHTNNWDKRMHFHKQNHFKNISNDKYTSSFKQNIESSFMLLSLQWHQHNFLVHVGLGDPLVS
jgi:hypothetical protein